MTTNTKKPVTMKTAKKATPKAATKAPAKKAKPVATKPEADAAPLPDPCANGHQWGTDGEGVEHCKVCLADRAVLEKPAKAKKAKPAPEAKATKPAVPTTAGKLSALDAAAKVLAEAQEPLNAKQMIEAMAANGLWTSFGGATPWATLYSAMLREIQVKGERIAVWQDRTREVRDQRLTLVPFNHGSQLIWELAMTMQERREWETDLTAAGWYREEGWWRHEHVDGLHNFASAVAILKRWIDR